jgi:monoamine oxidase
MFTARNSWADGQLAELGGELIDTGHHALRQLAAELGLILDPILEPTRSGIEQDTWFFGGRRVSDLAIIEMFRPVAVRLAQDVASEEQPAEFRRLDQLGLAAYLGSIPELDPLLRSIIDVAYVGEYGREIAEQSPWNLLWLIDSESASPFRIYGDSDEAFHIRAGNDQVTTLLAARLPRAIQLDHRLVSVVEKADGVFRLAFSRRGTSTLEADFDHVFFALPFTRLRQVEIKARLSAAKREIIDTLGMGTNAKLMGQFSQRVWRTQHRASGSVTTDNGLQLLWETSRGQAGVSGLLTVFAGGKLGEEIGQGGAEGQLLARLPKLDAIFPGTAPKYLAGSALRMHWPTVEHTLGSYTCYLPGQARFSGHEGQREGNLHFCGEQTSVDHQGYMNGGVESGERVAAELLADLGFPTHRVPSTASVHRR